MKVKVKVTPDDMIAIKEYMSKASESSESTIDVMKKLSGKIARSVFNKKEKLKVQLSDYE